MKSFVYGVLTLLLVITSLCLSAPEPAVVQGVDNWTVDVTFEQPQQIEVKVNGEDKPRRFFYVILTLTNNTKQEIAFYPKCDLMTDTFQVIPAGTDVPIGVFEDLKQRNQNKYPLLESCEQTDSRILQGSDNAKDIAIIWPDFDAEAKGFKLFIAGLSNESVAVDHPTEKAQDGKPKKIFLRKTLELEYAILGDSAFRSDAKLVSKGQRWVMR